MVNFIPSVLEKIHENADPTYLRQKEEAKNCLHAIGLITTATLVATVALVLFGMAIIATGAANAGGAGLAMIMINLSLGYVSYNANVISKNLSDIIENPKSYRKLLGLLPILDKQKIKQKLEQNTLCLNWLIEPTLEQMVRQGKML